MIRFKIIYVLYFFSIIFGQKIIHMNGTYDLLNNLNINSNTVGSIKKYKHVLENVTQML